MAKQRQFDNKVAKQLFTVVCIVTHGGAPKALKNQDTNAGCFRSPIVTPRTGMTFAYVPP
jgi:hypothetical protein